MSKVSYLKFITFIKNKKIKYSRILFWSKIKYVLYEYNTSPYYMSRPVLGCYDWKATKSMCICYGSQVLSVRGYTNLDYVGDLDNIRFTSSYIFTLAGGVVSWRSQLQSCVTQSTTEAEYVEASEACKEGIWLGRWKSRNPLSCSTRRYDPLRLNQWDYSLSNRGCNPYGSMEAYLNEERKLCAHNPLDRFTHTHPFIHTHTTASFSKLGTQTSIHLSQSHTHAHTYQWKLWWEAPRLSLNPAIASYTHTSYGEARCTSKLTHAFTWGGLCSSRTHTRA